MPLRERPAGTTLEIRLEGHGTFWIRKFREGNQAPRSKRSRVLGPAAVVHGKPAFDVVCQPGVVAVRMIDAAKHIDDAAVIEHALIGANTAALGFGWNSEWLNCVYAVADKLSVSGVRRFTSQSRRALVSGDQKLES